MPDYAISAVGRNPGNENLLSTEQSNEVLKFDEIGSRQYDPWDVENDPWNKLRIIEEPSSSNAQLKSEKAPWDDIASQTMYGLDKIQYRWDNVMNSSSFLDVNSNTDPTSKEGLSALRSFLQGYVKLNYHLIDSQLRMTMVTSIASTAKTSINTLYRQQG